MASLLVRASGESELLRGNAAFAVGDYEGSVAEYTRGLEAFKSAAPSRVGPPPRLLAARLYSNRSNAQLQRGNAVAALDDAERCLAVAPEWPKGLVRKGLALLCSTGNELGKEAEAEKCFAAASAQDPANRGALEVLLDVATQQRQAGRGGGRGGGGGGGGGTEGSRGKLSGWEDSALLEMGGGGGGGGGGASDAGDAARRTGDAVDGSNAGNAESAERATTWKCAGCTTVNSSFAEECSTCAMPNPNPAPAGAVGGGGGAASTGARGGGYEWTARDETQYCITLRDQSFGNCDMANLSSAELSSAKRQRHHYEAEMQTHKNNISKKRTKRITREIRVLRNMLPLASGASIFLRIDTNRPYMMQVG